MSNSSNAVCHNDNDKDNRERMHRQMLAALSHDLKTPLSTIIGSLEVYTRMEEKLTDAKRHGLISTALVEAYRLDNFISNILDIAKLESGLVKANTECCDIGLLLQDCLTRLGPKRAHGDIMLQSVDTTMVVYTDPVLLGRAAGLVLENALKYAGSYPVIIIEYGSDQDGVYVRIRDNGPGIPSGKEEEIFSKYTRFAKSDRQVAGTGLGLAICRQLMLLVSGTVEVSNHPEGGAVFTLSLPKR